MAAAYASIGDAAFSENVAAYASIAFAAFGNPLKCRLMVMSFFAAKSLGDGAETAFHVA